MRILAVDVGTGTQDVLLFDTDLQPENCFKLVLPSPTMMVARQVKDATRRKQPLLLTGVTMGGGPSHWAVRDHAADGNAVFATLDAAATFDDDPDRVRRMGIQVIDLPESQRLLRTRGDLLHLHLHDFDYQALSETLLRFGIDPHFDGVAVAVFDHGAAPVGVSDRQFRFDYLDMRLRAGNRLATFAFPSGEIPPEMSRLRAVAASAQIADLGGVPVMVMDTAPAAVLGALCDPTVVQRGSRLIANVGNFHTLAFRLGEGGVEGLFEHHTGNVTVEKLDRLLDGLADTTLRHEDVFLDEGHGALVYARDTIEPGTVAVTGPRRAVMAASTHDVYFAVPYGDMMIAGCWGLIRAWADVFPASADAIRSSLSAAKSTAPWELL